MLKPKDIISKGNPQPTGTVVAATSAGVDYTPLNAKARLARKTNGYLGSETEGVKVDKSGESTAKPFTRKVVVSQGGHTRIYGDDGTLIKEGEGHTKDIRDAVKASEKKVAITNNQRERNARAGNLIGGSAKNITRNEVNDLALIKHATGDQTGDNSDPRLAREKEKERKIHQLTEDNARKRVLVKKEADKKEADKTASFRVRIENKKKP